MNFRDKIFRYLPIFYQKNTVQFIFVLMPCALYKIGTMFVVGCNG